MEESKTEKLELHKILATASHLPKSNTDDKIWLLLAGYSWAWMHFIQKGFAVIYPKLYRESTKDRYCIVTGSHIQYSRNDGRLFNILNDLALVRYQSNQLYYVHCSSCCCSNKQSETDMRTIIYLLQTISHNFQFKNPLHCTRCSRLSLKID